MQKLTDQLVGNFKKNNSKSNLVDKSTAHTGSSARKDIGARASSQLNYSSNFENTISPIGSFTEDGKIKNILANK